MSAPAQAAVPATTASTQTAAAFDLPATAISGGGVIGIAVTLILGFMGLRRRWSKDNLELTKDRAETNLIASYQKTIADLEERNKRLDENAREAWKSRAEDAKRIGELTAKVENLTTTNQNLEKRITELSAMVAQMMQQRATSPITTPTI